MKDFVAVLRKALYAQQAALTDGLTRAFPPASARVLSQYCLVAIVGVMLMSVASDALAQSMPWEGPLCAVANSMKGTVAKSAAVIAIVIAGLALAFGEMSGIFKSIMGLIAGASMALLATNWLSFLGGGSSICTGVSL